MTERILFVDDEPILLATYQHQLQDQFDVCLAAGGDQGLTALRDKGPFAVVVSDLRMPGMNGAEFLASVCGMSPNSVRILLTGETNLTAAIDAVNEGHIFRLLTKPCPPGVLIGALRAAIAQHRLIKAEKELLELTLRGSIEVLADVLSLVSPVAFGRASRIRRLVKQLGIALHVKNPWQLEVAAMLSQIGCVSLPDGILKKIDSGTELTPAERATFEMHPGIGRDLIRKIPRLEEAAQIVHCQNWRYVTGEGMLDVPLAARILKVALDYEELESHGCERVKALRQLSDRQGWYAPEVLEALVKLSDITAESTSSELPVRQLRPGMILAEDLLNKAGALLARKGQEISGALHYRLLSHSANGTVREPVRVLIPMSLAKSEPAKSTDAVQILARMQSHFLTSRGE